MWFKNQVAPSNYRVAQKASDYQIIKIYKPFIHRNDSSIT